jgi:hypothetical protein
MKYFLIANNVNLTNKIINSLDIKHDDYIILFNHQFPMKYSRISNHKNKILFIRNNRKNTEDFNGIEQLKQNYKEFEKIYAFHKFYYDASSIVKKKFNDNENVYGLPSEVYAYVKTLDNSGKSCTTGLYAYIFFSYYYDNRDKIDKIVLVGFDLNYPDGMSNAHSSTFELNYYNNEFTKNNKLIKIKSSNKGLNDSEILENYQYNIDNINKNMKDIYKLKNKILVTKILVTNAIKLFSDFFKRKSKK